MAGGDDGETLPTADRTQGGSADWLVGPGGPPPTTASHESHRTSWGGTKALICWFAAPRARLTGFDVSCERRWIRFARLTNRSCQHSGAETGARSTEHARRGPRMAGRCQQFTISSNTPRRLFCNAVDIAGVVQDVGVTDEDIAQYHLLRTSPARMPHRDSLDVIRRPCFQNTTSEPGNLVSSQRASQASVELRFQRDSRQRNGPTGPESSVSVTQVRGR